MSTALNLIGQRFGKLTVIERFGSKRYANGNSVVLWKCLCDCGNYKITESHTLNRGKCHSCGCIVQLHGMHNTRIYRCWADMNARCCNKNCKDYNNYGGRGITVCEEWRNNFIAFYEWAIANGYTNELTIDRINVDGNYEPSNCRWVSNKIQANNKTTNRHISYKGNVYTIAELCKKLKLDRSVFEWRLRHNWDIEKAITTPVKKKEVGIKK